MADTWSIRCDAPECRALVAHEHEEPSEALLGVIAKAEQLGWLVAPSHEHGVRVGIRRGLLKDLCPLHRSKQ